MNSINELVGIIKGINFDGIVNKREAIYLKKWVDRNRNLANEVNEIQLIKLVDEVLEDDIISDDEREILLLYSQEFYKNITDDVARILELNGIIEGIICDGEVNEQEVYRLKDWMNAYGDSIREHKPSKKLCNCVDDILEDGIVSDVEQEQLLMMLSLRINSAQFETKLDRLRKLVKSRQNIGIELIDILDDEKAQRQIHKYSQNQLRCCLNSYTGTSVRDPEVVFISLVLIAMLNYDRNYYDHVERTYFELYQNFSEQRIEGLIRTILNRYKHDEQMGVSRTRIINIVLSNAIVPSHYLPAFFDFIYDIYIINFGSSLPNDLYEEFKFAYEGLRTSIDSDNDELQLNVTRKTYKLIKTTNQLIVNGKDLAPIIKLSCIIAKLIDKRIWNTKVQIVNPYLKYGYENWEFSLKDNDLNSINRTSNHDIHSRWEPKIILNNSGIYIKPPVHKIKAKYNYSDIYVVANNFEDEIYIDSNPDIREIVGGYELNIENIKIEKPLGRLNYKIKAGNETIYDSKDKLCRDFIVFDPVGAEIKNNHDYSGTAVFCCKNEHEHLKTFHKAEHYILSSKIIKQGDSCVIENEIFNFSKFIKPGVVGEKYENCFLVDATSKEHIPVYRNVKYIAFESNNKRADYIIEINGRAKKLNSFDYSISERDGVNKYAIDIDLDKSDIYAVVVYEVFDNKRKKLLSLQIALDLTLEVEELKIDDENFLVCVKTDFCSFAINSEIVVDEFYEDWIKIEHRGAKYSYRLPFKFDFYRISNSSWVPYSKAIWIGDINQETTLDIFTCAVDQMQVYSSTGEILFDELEFKNMITYQQISVGFLMSYKSSYDYTILHLLKDGILKKKILCYNRCVLNENETELLFDPVAKSLQVITNYWGKGRVFFTINNATEDQVFKSEYIESGNSTVIECIKSFEKYKICFYEKPRGLSLAVDRLMKKFNKEYYSWDDLIDRSFKINKVYFDQLVGRNFLRKSHFFNKSYVTFISKEGDSLYSGNLHTKTSRGDYMLYAINPALIEICSDVIDDTIELSITKDGDGLFIDFDYHGIKNTLEDRSATDIFSYIVDLKGAE